MVMHWLRKGGQVSGLNLVYNGLGALTTGIVLAIIIVAKFTQGAWLVVVLAPALVFLLHKINHHYKRIKREVEEPLWLEQANLKPPVVIVPISGLDRVTAKAVRIGALLSNDIIALHICTERDDKRRLRKLWDERVADPAKEVNLAVPRLEMIDSPYRRIYRPILDFVSRTKKEHPDRLVAVIIPELVEPHWYEYLLHNLHGQVLKSLLYFKGDDRTIVVNSPWYLKDM